ncbi:MAG: phosphatidylglycerol lysyltransferase domain-containing protein [Candidatus Saccharimonadales bacterium]
MKQMIYPKHFLGVRREFLLLLSIHLVGLHGIFILTNTILIQLAIHHGTMEATNNIYIDSLAGLSLVYLWSLLRRHKLNAWLVTVGVYVFILGANLSALQGNSMSVVWGLEAIERVIVPLSILGPLLYFRNSFRVRSDIRSFGQAVRITCVLLLVTFAYGVSGFLVLDNKDFHEEISLPVAAHRTVDQFDLTTSHPLIPHTRRAKVFMDSLSIISTGSAIFVFISFFQPLRARHSHQKRARNEAEHLLSVYSADSEDFFKLWPHDKAYLFSDDKKAGLAYRVERGVALVIGDPFGAKNSVHDVVRAFEELCYTNDWLPAFVHSQPSWQKVYERFGYTTQLIGQEAVVTLGAFLTNADGDKYFRNIRNRFEKQGYTTQLLMPPHDNALLQRLRTISDDWLTRPGRTERGFVMGNFNHAYLQQCPVLVARDSAGTIQGFLNQVPTFNTSEANYDMLRSATTALGNINDYLLVSFMEDISRNGYERINLGLSPLAGIEESDDSSLVSTAMRLIYRGGARFYSFQGLRKFKAKYNPEWSDRFIVYKNGVSGFTRTVRALIRAMNHLS